MKYLLPPALVLLLAACHDAPQAPPCRTSVPPSPERASSGCLILQDGHLLVFRHRFGGKLGIPGGGAREGESARCTAHRETWEETGLDVRVGEKLGRLRYGFTLFACQPDEPLDVAVTPELPWHAWLEVADMLWLRPGEVPLDQWRYEGQERAFMEVVEQALPDGQAPDGRP